MDVTNLKPFRVQIITRTLPVSNILHVSLPIAVLSRRKQDIN